MKKIIKCKNSYCKVVNNHKNKNHKMGGLYHIVNRGIVLAYKEMIPVYAELDSDYSQVDLLDFNFYERWLNG